MDESQQFRRMWGIPLDPTSGEIDTDEEAEENLDETTATGKRMFERMEDVELVLRFFAYRQIGDFKAGLNKISEFLDRFLVGGNRFSESLLTEYRIMFESTISFLWDTLAVDAFTLLDQPRRRATKIVYDPIMYVANSAEVVPHHAKLVEGKAVLRTELDAMYNENHLLFSGRRTNFVDTQNRNRCVRNAFAAAIAKTQNS